MKDAFDLFSIGFMAPWRGLGLFVSKPRLQRYIIVPVLVSLAVFLFVGGFALYQLWSLIPALALDAVSLIAPAAAGWFAVTLKFVVLVLLWPVMLIVLLYILLLATKVIGAPFHALLAERILIEEGVIMDRPFNFGEWMKLTLKMLWVSLIKVAIFVVVGAVLFLVSFFPGLNLIASFAALLLVAFDLADYSFEALQLGFRDRVRFFRVNLSAFAGLAAAMGLIFFVPGLNFFLFPASVAGASDVVRRLSSPRATIPAKLV